MKKFYFLFLIIASSQLSAQNVPNYIPTNGLVAWYPFSGNANDESGNGNNATYIGTGVTLTADSAGNANSAFAFDGQTGSYIRVPADNFPTNDRTISLWFKTSSVANRPMLMGYGGGGCSGSGTSFLMGLNVSGGGSYETQAHFVSNVFDYTYSSDPVNAWINWVVTINGSTINFYINGVAVPGSGTFSNTTVVAGTDFVFGVMPWCDGAAPYTDVNGGYFTGMLDDIGIWNRALSSIEISNVYHGTNTGIAHVTTNSFRIFPTSTQDMLHVQATPQMTGKEFFIYDVTGQVVKTGILRSSEMEIEISSLEKGVYFFQVPSTSTTKRFVKM